eukprot:487286-Rhodomonas_salina.1
MPVPGPLRWQAGDGAVQGLWTAGAGAGGLGKGRRSLPLGRGRPVQVRLGLRVGRSVDGGLSVG